jgi:hypothetical protein
MIFSNGFLFGADIMSTIQTYIQTYRDIILSFFNGLNNLWIQAAILVGLALFAVIGLFVFIKKFIKLFVVLGILGGVFYYLWDQGIIQDLWSNVTGFIAIFLSTL